MAAPADDRPGVTAVVLNWNGQGVVGDCLRSLQAQDWPALEILVVDNASTDGSAEMIRRQFPGVRLQVNAENLGFGGGNNVGINLAVTPVDATGIVVCPDGLSLGRGRAEPPEAFGEPAEVFYASDCCCLYRRAMLEALRLPDGELYDEDFFAYADETDMGWRAQRLGWKSLYEPSAVVYHHHAASSGSVSPLLVRLVERNRIWVAVKNFPTWLLACGAVWSVWRTLWQVWGGLTGRGRAGALGAERSKAEVAAILWRAYREAAAGLTRMLRKRNAIRRTGRLGVRRIREIFRRFGIAARDIALRE